MTQVFFDPLDHDAITVLSSHTGLDFRHVHFIEPQWLCVTARGDDGHVEGVLVGEFPQWFECHITLAIVDRSCVRIAPKIMRAFFTAVFSRATRCTAQVRPDNKPAVAQVRRLGFVYEGFMRRAINGQHDALLFGMLKEECPFLPGYVPFDRPDADLKLTPVEALQ